MKILILSLLASFSLFATEPSHYEVKVGHKGTSDKLIKKEMSLSYKNHRRDLGWPYPGAEEKAWDMGFNYVMRDMEVFGNDFFGVRPAVTGGKKISKNLNVEGELAYHSLRNKNNDATGSMLSYGLRTQFRVFEWSYVAIELLNDFAYKDMFLPKSTNEKLRSFDIRAREVITIPSWLRSVFFIEHKNYSDDNSRWNFDLESKYKLFPKLSWFWVGLGYNYLTNDKDLAGYWTPKKFKSFGPRLETAFTIYEKLSASLAFNYNRFKEDNFSWGSGYYSNLSLRYGDRDKSHVLLNVERILSEQNSQEWSSTDVSSSFIYFF